MSVTETQALPAGAWAVDKIHSDVGFGPRARVAPATRTAP
jgi:hypothetical protein